MFAAYAKNKPSLSPANLVIRLVPASFREAAHSCPPDKFT